LLSFDSNLLGTSAAVLDGSDGISWGRWTNGTVAGSGLFAGADTQTAPLHWVAGLPTANMPTGSASYSMIGATPPSCSPLCTSAVLDHSSLVVNFDNAAVNLNIGITVDGIAYSPATTTRTIPLIISGSSFNGSGPMGANGTTLSAAGFFAGDAAVRAGLAYELNILMLQSVNGAIAYKKDAQLAP